MKFLVIGLGSMGKRRIRCLQALHHLDMVGFDVREDRRKEAQEKYGIKTIHSIENTDLSMFDAFIISTPPNMHTYYAKKAIDHKKPAFIEASVIIEDVIEMQKYNQDNTFIAPSCTLRFHPIIKDITKIIKEGKYGKITNFSYHSGQYLPDWHPWEKVEEFYVSQRIMGGGREIVPFELTWIVDTIGWPESVKGAFAKTIDFGSDIEDTYVFTLNYKNKLGAMVVDVASRYAVRNLIINMEKAQIQWKWDESAFNLFEVENNRWIRFNQPQFESAEGYNKNIGEKMYIDEISCFLDGMKDSSKYPNTVEDDIKVLELLNNIEKTDGGF